ncbi:helix-turn-helix transcriptional regulator [Cupriavidus sp. EM10]|nr:helix-turn-helix transcriptional regulator [Cupriavidus sp. EM10]
METSRCAVFDAATVVGDRWTMLILREALHGKTHFDEFERGLGVATNVLSSRLKLLLGNDLLERRRSAGPGSRLTYHLTEKGRAFFPVYVALKSWADQWWPQSDRAGVRLYDVKTGEEIVAAALARADGSEIRCEDMVCKLCTSRSEALA